MPKLINRLSALKIQTLNQKGYHCDGLGLYLRISHTGSKSWVYRFCLFGRSREMGLGGYPLFTIAQARERARQAKRQVSDGIDPIEHRALAHPQRIKHHNPPA
jgi:hypothetical protein